MKQYKISTINKAVIVFFLLTYSGAPIYTEAATMTIKTAKEKKNHY